MVWGWALALGIDLVKVCASGWWWGVLAIGIGHAPYVCLERDSLVVVLGGQGCMC